MESSLPLRALETDFAVDSTCFSTSRFEKWFDVRWGHEVSSHVWMKAHLCCGVKTHIVTDVKVTGKECEDAPELPALVEATTQNFLLNEVSADKAYYSIANLNAVTHHGGTAFVPFKENMTGDGGDGGDGDGGGDAVWQKMFHFYAYHRDEYYTDHFGMVSDYLTEVLRTLRKGSYTDAAERHFRFGSHLTGRDQKAVRKTVSGLLKLLHPDGQATKDEIEEYMVFAMEMRRRLKEQLKKIAGVEYWDVNFSYRDLETGSESFVGVPEMGGDQIIQPGAMAPGAIYTIGRDMDSGKLAFFLLQTQISAGSGRIIPLGNLSHRMHEGIKTAEAYLKANAKNLGITRDFASYDFSIQAINLSQAKEGAETAVASFVALVTALLEKPVREQLVVLGEMSVQGLLLKVSNLSERLQLALEAGAKQVLLPSENQRDLADVPDDVLNKLQAIFYTDPTNAAILAMGLE